MDAETLKLRETTALRVIKHFYGKPEGEYGPTLFVSHHLEILEPAYWLSAIGTEQPDSNQILNCLVLVDSWSSKGDDNIDTLDFGLPDSISTYLVSVRFREDGHVQYVSMEG